MDEDKKQLKGSPSRDDFKYWHKQKVGKLAWACDLDFVLVNKPPRIIAFLDFKKKGENVTFSEVMAYEVLKSTAPIFIIRSNNPSGGPFVVWEYLSCKDYRPDPPILNLKMVRQCGNWDDLKQWEYEIRNLGGPSC